MIIVIPARGGSKRVPFKNIRSLKGKPLLSYTLDAVSESGLSLPTYVSTDNEQIANVARSYTGVKVLIRPENIANDTSSTESVLLHALHAASDFGQTPQWMMTLPPTAPLRTAASISSFAKEAMSCEDNIDSFMSVSENRGDFWKMTKIGMLERLFPGASRRQQERQPLYEENSAIYVTRTEALRKTGFILGKSVRGIVIPITEAFDINNSEYFEFAECIHDSLFKVPN